MLLSEYFHLIYLNGVAGVIGTGLCEASCVETNIARGNEIKDQDSLFLSLGIVVPRHRLDSHKILAVHRSEKAAIML